MPATNECLSDGPPCSASYSQIPTNRLSKKSMITNPKLKLALLTIFLLTTCRAYATEPQQTEITGQPFDADLFTTKDSTKKLGILVLGGAEGGKQVHLAKPFAEAGYPTMALAYFKTK